MDSRLDQILDTLADEEDKLLSEIGGPRDGTDVLEKMRDKGIAWIASDQGWKDLTASSRFFRQCVDRMEADLPDDVSWADVLLTQDLFGRYGNEIGSALLLAALPQTYATERGRRCSCARAD